MATAEAPGEAPSSRRDEAAAGWYDAAATPPLGRWTKDLGDRRAPKWDTFSWTTLRTLFESINDFVAERAPTIVRDRRRRLVAAQRAAGAERPDGGPPTPGAGAFGPDFVVDWTSLERPRFLILGDPGEADASQYALIEPLAAVHDGKVPWESRHARRASDFLVVLSDVIYPAGDVNDYENGFYIPFARYDRPIYAVPGNHDWYDGLEGFMFHFCLAEPPAPTRFSNRGRSLGERIVRALWRRASRPDRDRLAPMMAARNAQNLCRRDGGRPAPHAHLRPVQPASYFAIELADAVLVAIDTGVDGVLDAEQGSWLLRISCGPKPKVLLTGKPLLSGGERQPGAIEWGEAAPPAYHCFATVDDVVRHAPHRYVAAIGGDTHNYQRYPVHAEDRTIEYIVAGGGGAYLSATHMIPRADPGQSCAEEEFRCYPLRGDSLALFCGRMGPLLFKSLVTTLAVVATAAAMVLWLIDVDSGRKIAAAVAAGATCGAALIARFLFAFMGRVAALHGRGQPVLIVLLAVAGVVALLVGLADERATTAAIVAVATPLVLVAGAVAAYSGRGRLLGRTSDWLPIVPLIALPPAIWAPYGGGPAAQALLYGLVPLGTALAAVSLAGALRGSAGRAIVFRVLAGGLWAALAAVLVARFGAPWIWRSLLAAGIAALVIGLVVPRLGPGRTQVHQRRDDTIGTFAGVVIALALAAIALVGLDAVAGPDGAAATAAGVAALAGAVAALAALYLLLFVGLIDPRATWHLRTGAITPAGAAEFVARKLRLRTSTTRGVDPAAADAGRQRMAEVVWRLGKGVSPIADTNEPPFFKSFLSAEIDGATLTLRAWGVTGYADPARSPSLEDEVAIPLGLTGGPR
jgi:hypothetical protein